ncbi:MAG: hypothetical protein K2Q01_06740 [Rickettsiales bacterium]|nr:hypothetical protein [Rickettsiales bacterium]
MMAARVVPPAPPPTIPPPDAGMYANTLKVADTLRGAIRYMEPYIESVANDINRKASGQPQPAKPSESPAPSAGDVSNERNWLYHWQPVEAGTERGAQRIVQHTMGPMPWNDLGLEDARSKARLTYEVLYSKLSPLARTQFLAPDTLSNARVMGPIREAHARAALESTYDKFHRQLSADAQMRYPSAEKLTKIRAHGPGLDPVNVQLLSNADVMMHYLQQNARAHNLPLNDPGLLAKQAEGVSQKVAVEISASRLLEKAYTLFHAQLSEHAQTRFPSPEHLRGIRVKSPAHRNEAEVQLLVNAEAAFTYLKTNATRENVAVDHPQLVALQAQKVNQKAAADALGEKSQPPSPPVSAGSGSFGRDGVRRPLKPTQRGPGFFPETTRNADGHIDAAPIPGPLEEFNWRQRTGQNADNAATIDKLILDSMVEQLKQFHALVAQSSDAATAKQLQRTLPPTREFAYKLLSDKPRGMQEENVEAFGRDLRMLSERPELLKYYYTDPLVGAMLPKEQAQAQMKRMVSESTGRGPDSFHETATLTRASKPAPPAFR